MKPRPVFHAVAALVGLAGSLVSSQAPPPDFSGIWRIAPAYSRATQTLDGKPVPVTMAGQAELDYLRKLEDAGKLPIHNTQMGWPKGFIHGSRVSIFNFEIVQEPKQVSFFFEEDHQYFMAYVGATHPLPVKPSFLGDSVAHWEGDTLVIDTVGFNGMTPIGSTPISDKLHTVMRLRLVDGGKALENIITIDDPVAFTRTWQMKLVYDKRPATERLSESVYAENNRNLPDLDEQR